MLQPTAYCNDSNVTDACHCDKPQYNDGLALRDDINLRLKFSKNKI